MDFIYYVNLVISLRRSKFNILSERPDFVYSPVRSTVYLNNIQTAALGYSISRRDEPQARLCNSVPSLIFWR